MKGAPALALVPVVSVPVTPRGRGKLLTVAAVMELLPDKSRWWITQRFCLDKKLKLGRDCYGGPRRAVEVTCAAIATRILSNGWRLMWCDRCEGNLEDSAECYQVQLAGAVRIYCPKCHRRIQREQLVERVGKRR